MGERDILGFYMGIVARINGCDHWIQNTWPVYLFICSILNGYMLGQENEQRSFWDHATAPSTLIEIWMFLLPFVV